METKLPLPLRKRVEVIIKRDDGTFLLIKGDPEKYPKWRAFPGGGMDDQTPEEACINEALEEVGIRVKNVRYLNVHLPEPHVSAKGDRKSEFSGSETYWYDAVFVGIDTSKLGSDNDAKDFEWLHFSKAQDALITSGGPRTYCQLMALTEAYKRIPLHRYSS